MKKSGYDPKKHHRRSIRLKGHDYAGGGLYFVTLCAHRDAGNIFGHEGAKEILARIWEEICRDALDRGADTRPARTGAPCVCPSSELKAYCIMPDHFHGLIQIKKGTKALGDFICAFKSRTTLEYVRGVKVGKLPPFREKIWHRNYYEMIVCSREAEAKIAEYIQLNPWRCVQDFRSGLRGMGNPALWNVDKMGVLCSRNAPRPKSIPKAAAYMGGFHSPMEKEILEKLLEHKRRVIWCPAWELDRAAFVPGVREALENNRMLILEMRDTTGNLAAAESRNRFVLDKANHLWLPHINPGGMIDRLIQSMNVQQKIKPH